MDQAKHHPSKAKECLSITPAIQLRLIKGGVAI